MRRRPRIKTGIEIGDPDAPEIYGRPGIHEASRGNHHDVPLSHRGRFLWFALLAGVILAATLLLIFTADI